MPDLPAGRYLIVQPEQQGALRGSATPDGEPVVAYDELGANINSRVSFSEGREASAPFHPESVPTDAYIAAILDEVQIRSRVDGEAES